MGLVQQQNPMPGMMPGQTHNQPQQNFPRHLQHQMQASPIPMQHQPTQMTTGIDNQALQAPSQQRQVFPTNGQPPPQQRPPNQDNFTAEENDEINRMAQQMAQNMSPEELQKVRADYLQKIPVEQRAGLARKNVDPLPFFFRTQATRQFKMRKANSQARFNAQQQNRALGGVAGGAPGQQRQMPQNPGMGQGQQPGGAPGSNNFDQWMGNVENFVGQQADALRASEAGQLVVPASQVGGISATVPPGQPGQLRTSVAPQGGTQMTMAQQQLYSMQQAQQEKIQQAAQIEARSQAQARANAAKAQHMALQGQPGGMTPHLGQRPPQQSPAMPMLNRPLGPSGQQASNQASNQGTPQQPSQQGTPHMGQQPGQPPDPRFPQQLAQQGRGPATQPDGQRSNQPVQLPEGLKQHLQRLPPEQREPFYRQWQQQQQQRAAQARQQAAQNAAQQGIAANPMASQPQMPHPGPQMPQPGMQHGPTNGQLGGGQNPNFPPRPSSTHQTIVNGMPNQSQPQPTPQQRAQQPQQSQLQQQKQQQMLRQHQQQRQQAQAAMQYMTPERVMEMDGKEFPKTILNAQNPVSQPPDHVKTWGQLKAWVAQSPQQVQHGRLEQLKNLQSLHWMTSVQNPQQRQQLSLPAQIPPAAAPSNQLMGQAPPAQMVPQGIAAQVAPMGQPTSGQPFAQQQQLPPGITIPQPTDEEVMSVRPQLPPHLQHLTDAQVKGLIMHNKQKKVMAAIAAKSNQPQQPTPQQAAQVAQMQKAQFQQGQQLSQQRQINQGVKGPATAQQQPQPQPQPQQRPAQQPPPTPDTKAGKTPAAGKQGRPNQQNRAPPPSQQPPQPSQGTKRPSSDDVVEVPNPSLQKSQQNVPTNVPTFNPKTTQQRLANVQLTEQQLAVMTPQQRAQFEQQRRNPMASAANGQQHQQQQAAAPTATRAPNQADADRSDARLKEIFNEVVRTNPKRQIIQMSAEEKEVMCQKLRQPQNQQIVKRVESTVPIFFRLTGDERIARDLLSTVLTLEYEPSLRLSD